MHEEVVPGRLLAGKYRVERVLGRGGMGVVVAAQHIVLDQVVAIKFLLPEALNSAEAVARFEREARAAVKIQSEHVARVTDVGRLETGAPYMVMELLRGRDLGDLLQQSGPLPLEDVADYILQAGEAIAEAHGLGIVHRDLKPPNLFLTTRADGSSCVKVLDFGISKVTGLSASSEQGLTSTTAIMGSPLYMSPEQLMSARDVDMTTDIWALGVICYELLTGQPPFVAETLPQLCMAISTQPPTPLRNHRPDLPVEVEAVLLRCLEKDRGKRFATVSALANELVKFAPRRSRLSAERIERLARAAGFSASVLALPPSSDNEVAATTHPGSGTMAAFGHTRPAAATSKLRVMFFTAAALAVGATAVFALRRPTPEPASGAPTLPSTTAAASQLPVSTATASPPAESAPTATTEPAASANLAPSSTASAVLSRHLGSSKHKLLDSKLADSKAAVLAPSATTPAATPMPTTTTRSRL